MNIIKLQDSLKNLSDAQLAQEMSMPSGSVPQFLLMTEMNRRKEMREGAMAGSAKDQPSIAEEMVAQAQPQGIVGLPDETLAGAAMRARILGQQQQAGDMTVNPPQEAQMMARGGYVDYMAEGGAPRFGGIFGNAPTKQDGIVTPPYFNAQNQNSGAAALEAYNAPIVPQVVPADRTAARTSGTDLGNFDPRKNQYYVDPNRRNKPAPAITPENFAYSQDNPFRMNLPPGVPKPREGTPGMLSQDRGRDRSFNYFANPEARDTYIRSYIPSWNRPAPTASMAEGGIASLMEPKRMSDGGPSFMQKMLMGSPLTAPYYLTGRALEDYLNELGLEQKAEAARAAEAKAPGTEAGKPLGQPKASPTASVSGPAPMGGNPLMPKQEAAAEPAAPKAAEGNSFLKDYQDKVSSLLDRLGTSEADDERAKNMAIMKAGLAMAAGKDPNFLTNVATGAMSGLEDYSSSRDAAKKAEAARAAAEVEALGTAARLQQAENERADTADYRRQALDVERDYKKAMAGIYGQRGGASSSAASMRTLASLYSSIGRQIKDINADILMDPSEKEAKIGPLEAQLADIRIALSEVDPTLMIGMGGGAGAAPAVTADLQAAAIAKLKALGIEP